MVVRGLLSGSFLLALALASAPDSPVLAHPGQPGAAIPAVVEKATVYVRGYTTALSSVVSEERYEQIVISVVSRGAAPAERQVTQRVLLSDYLLVQVPGTREWSPFRDVYSVDGVPVRDRDERLLKILLEPGTSAVARALQIRDESSRYNIGRVTRDINVPTFALQVLDAERARFAFREAGRDTVEGRDTVVVEYRETAVPTLVVGRNDENVPATGRFWILPESGTVVRSSMETRPPDMRTRIEVTYRYQDGLGHFVPSEMFERHDLVNERIEARSTYSRFRRFRVDTSFEIK